MVRPISTKFGTTMQFDPLKTVDCWKFEILKIQDGGGRNIVKSKNNHILAAIWPILTKSDMATQFCDLDF